MAGTKHKHRNYLAFQTESAPCVPTGSWDSATWIEFRALDLANVKEALIVNPTLERTAFAVGKRTRIRGIRNVPWSAVIGLHGTGATTSTDSQVAATYLSTIFAWCMGGQHRSYTRAVVSGADEHTITVGAGKTTGFIPGCMVAVEDRTSPAAGDLGKLHFRKVISVNGGTDTITLSEDLPFVPASGDIVHGTITNYLVESYLESAVRAGAVRTLSWFAMLTRGDNDHLWQLEGTVGSMSFQGLGRGELPSVTLNMQSANFSHGSEDGLSEPTPGTAQGKPSLAMGLDFLFNVGDYGDETLATRAANAIGFEPGLTRTPVPGVTEDIDRFEGLIDYTFTPSDTKVTATLVPYAQAWYAALNDGDEHRLTLYQPGPGGATGGGVGKAWAIHVPRAQLTATPGRTDVDQVHGVALEWGAMIPDDCTGGSNTDLEQSPFVIALA